MIDNVDAQMAGDDFDSQNLDTKDTQVDDLFDLEGEEEDSFKLYSSQENDKAMQALAMGGLLGYLGAYVGGIGLPVLTVGALLYTNGFSLLTLVSTIILAPITCSVGIAAGVFAGSALGLKIGFMVSEK
ncbi:MAG: hypothetical protein DGJ47_000445 [Rickettsiaceae bacterium]